MVCSRCVHTIRQGAQQMGLLIKEINLGRVYFDSALQPAEQIKLVQFLREQGFELLSDRHTRLIHQVKVLADSYIQNQSRNNKKVKFSSMLSETLNLNYDSISEIFSSSESLTIEKYLINRRIEKVIELLVYFNKNLTEISHALGYSSISHLSAQFKQITGFTPSHYRKIKYQKGEISKQAS